MKTKIITFFAMFTVLFTFATLNVQANPDEIKVFINNEQIIFDVPPKIIDDRTLVPFRAIFEKLNYTVIYNNEPPVVMGVNFNNYKFISFKIGESFMVVSPFIYENNKIITTGEQKKELDVPAQIIDDRTLVPLRAVAESAGEEVYYDEATNTVYIGTRPQPQTGNTLNHTYKTTFYGLNIYEDNNGVKYVEFGDVLSDCNNCKSGIYFVLADQSTNTWQFLEMSSSTDKDVVISSGGLHFFDNMKGAYILADDYLNTMENILH